MMEKETKTARTPTRRQRISKAEQAHRAHLLTVLAAVVAIVGNGLLITGFIVPPLGEIHPSVLIAFGEGLTFVGTVVGVKYNYKYKYLTHNP